MIRERKEEKRKKEGVLIDYVRLFWRKKEKRKNL
jgi:hypothetical protein